MINKEYAKDICRSKFKLILIRTQIIFSIIAISCTLFQSFAKEVAVYVKAKQLSKLREFLISIKGIRFLTPELFSFDGGQDTWFGVRRKSKLLEFNNDYIQVIDSNHTEQTIANLLTRRNNLLKNASINHEEGLWKLGINKILEADRVEDDAARLLNLDPLKLRILGSNITSSIGHSSFGLNLRAKMLTLSSNPVSRYLVFPQKESNLPYLKYWDQFFNILDWDPRKTIELERSFWFLLESISSVRVTSTHSVDLISAHNSFSLEWEKQKREAILKLSERHTEQGLAFLQENFGMNQNDWFVTVHVRDTTSWNPNYGRNADIYSYFPAFKHIVDQGGHVIRIGNKDSKKLPNIPGVIDYAHFPEKSRLMDVFFLAKARFFIATTSGPIGVASSFGTPILWTNAPDVGKAVFHPKSLMIPKLIQNKGKRVLGMSEILSSSLGYTDSYIERLKNYKENFEGFSWRDNEDLEILEGVREMMAGLFDVTGNGQYEFMSILESFGSSGSTKVASFFINKWREVMYS